MIICSTSWLDQHYRALHLRLIEPRGSLEIVRGAGLSLAGRTTGAFQARDSNWFDPRKTLQSRRDFYLDSPRDFVAGSS